MDIILGIKFREYGQVYFFHASGDPVIPGERVIVETDQGQGIGDVVVVRGDLPVDVTEEDVRPILRRATPEDLEQAAENDLLGRDARRFCQECIRARDLEMKLVDVEVFFDRSKLIFYFTAPTRIDFRELVKDLVKQYRTRIELRQIGVRHETQMIGAVGNCGMVCCCRRFLRKFAPVTIKMAKEQNLFLNPAKISGICGRLLCCLSYEQSNYEEFHRSCPRLGKKYVTSKGTVKVLRANMFRSSLSVLTETGEEAEFTLDEWKDMDPRRPDQQPQTQQAGQSPQQHKPRREREQPAPQASSQHTPLPHGDEGFVVASGSPEGDIVVAPLALPQGEVKQALPGATQVALAAGDGVVAQAGGELDATRDAAAASDAGRSGKAVAEVGKADGAVEPRQQEGGTTGQPDARAQAGPQTPTEARTEVQPESRKDEAAAPAPVAPSVAQQAPAAIAMPRHQIKSTDASALRSSRGRRKRKRRPRDGGAGDGPDMD